MHGLYAWGQEQRRRDPDAWQLFVDFVDVGCIVLALLTWVAPCVVFGKVIMARRERLRQEAEVEQRETGAAVASSSSNRSAITAAEAADEAANVAAAAV